MNRGDAYLVLANELELLRRLGFDAMLAQIGKPTGQKTVLIAGAPVTIETSVRWADQKRRAIRISAIALGPSCGSMERLDESIVVFPDRLATESQVGGEAKGASQQAQN